jgi:hypothetical protein
MVSAYIKFSQAKRGEIQAANPGAGFGELGKLIGAEWQKLSPTEKASYGAASPGKTRKTRSNKGGHHRMQKTKEVYKGLPVYTNKNIAKGVKGNKGRPTRKAGRKANPYANFVKAHWAEMKAKNPDASLGDISKQIAVLWKAQK